MPRRLISEDSTLKGIQRYNRTSDFWEQIQTTVCPLLTGSGVLVFVVVFFNDHLRRLIPDQLIPVLIVINSLMILLGVLLLIAAKWSIKRNRINDKTHWLVLYYMKEMGVRNPKRQLKKHPNYIDAYTEVWVNVLRVNVHTRDAERIGSLVLHDERSLELTPQLIALIQNNPAMGYTRLSKVLDTLTPDNEE